MLNKICQVVKMGGYIPHGDYLIPPEVDFQNFSYYGNKLNDIIEKTGAPNPQSQGRLADYNTGY
jgi:hypothetical protein